MLLETSVALLLSLGSGSCLEVPEMRGVNIAGMLIDLKRGGSLQVNDGIPKVVITDGQHMRVYYDPTAANPLKGKPSGMAYGQAINDPEAKSDFTRLMFNGPVTKDVLLFDNPHSDVMYPRAMRQRYSKLYKESSYGK